MSIIFYDLETFGLSPALDRIAEFAGILTDERLELQEQPYELRCLPPPDYIASPGACLTTGITPQAALQTGLPEPDFARRVHRWFTARPETLILGYNSAAFDDEFIRHLFYRTFLDPYGWHFRNGNRRMDLFSVMPGLFDFHRDVFVWPRTAHGEPDFRLEALAESNDALGGTSHEALSDTFALRNLTKKIQERLPDVWESLPTLLEKRAVEARLWSAYRSGPLVDAGDDAGADAKVGASAYAVASGIVIYASARIRTSERASSLFLPVGREAHGAGQWWLLNLDRDAQPLIDLDPEELGRTWYSSERPTATRQLQRINPRRFPFIIPAGERQLEVLESHGLAREDTERHLRGALTAGLGRWVSRFLRAFGDGTGVAKRGNDVDGQLYDGLPNDGDQTMLQEISTATTPEIATFLGGVTFSDQRYRVLKERFFGRYVSQRLSSGARKMFREEAMKRLDIEHFDLEWREAAKQIRGGTLPSGLTAARQRAVMNDLREHRNGVVQRMGLEGLFGLLDVTEAP